MQAVNEWRRPRNVDRAREDAEQDGAEVMCTGATVTTGRAIINGGDFVIVPAPRGHARERRLRVEANHLAPPIVDIQESVVERRNVMQNNVEHQRDRGARERAVVICSRGGCR